MSRRPASTWLLPAALAALGLSLAVPAVAAPPREMIVCYPGKPGSASAAKPTMDTLTDHLAKESGFGPGGLSATYFNDEKLAREHAESARPHYGILSLGVYLKWKKAGRKLTPIAMSERRGSLTERFHALVPTGSARRSLQDLKGAVVVSNYLEDPDFATRVVFGGQLSVSKDIALVTTRTPSGMFRCCAGRRPMSDGRAVDAIVLDDDQLTGFKERPEMKQLTVIWSSAALPTPPVVSFDETADAAESKRLGGAFQAMAATPEGRAILETIQASGFKPVPAGAYSAVEKAY